MAEQEIKCTSRNSKVADILRKVETSDNLSGQEIYDLLKAEGEDLALLYNLANKLCLENMGNEVYIRGIIEISNYCQKNCNYCGIRYGNPVISRYRMKAEEILETCKGIEKNMATTVVLQSGEDDHYSKEKVGDIVKAIKQETGLAVTLSLGIRDTHELEYWKECGCDRYLLRFETSKDSIFKLCHPDDTFQGRLQFIKELQVLGIQAGSGFMIGLPTSSLEDLVQDILFCSSLHLDMIGVGPFIVNQDTPLKKFTQRFDIEVYFKTMAILRLLNKRSHIPATTAFDVLQPNGRELLLQRGCNVYMPNCTPINYRKLYMLYPGKPLLSQSLDDNIEGARQRIISCGRVIGAGKGNSLFIKGGS